jgi:hypothetical protein
VEVWWVAALLEAASWVEASSVVEWSAEVWTCHRK